MRTATMVMAGALGGALIAVAAVFAAAASGLLPQAPATGAAIRSYLLAHPDILAEMNDRYQAQQQALADEAAAQAMRKIGLKPFFDPAIAFVTGPADAKKSLVEFYDYNCPYCRASLPAVEKFFQAHKNDTRFSFIEFPIKGPDSTVAARAALAARRQPDKYLALHFALMGESGPVDEAEIYRVAAKVGLDVAKLKADMKDPALDQAIAQSHALAKRAGIDGTPTFIINGAMHPGAVDDETLNALTKAG